MPGLSFPSVLHLLGQELTIAKGFLAGGAKSIHNSSPWLGVGHSKRAPVLTKLGRLGGHRGFLTSVSCSGMRVGELDRLHPLRAQCEMKTWGCLFKNALQSGVGCTVASQVAFQK